MSDSVFDKIQAMSEAERRTHVQKAFQMFSVKEDLGRIFVALVYARQFLDNEKLAGIFAPPCSYLLLMLRQRMAAGDFTERELRASAEDFLLISEAPEAVSRSVALAINEFVAIVP